jgi:hypothetical protein
LNLTYNPNNFIDALGVYSAQVAKYPYLDLGFNLTYPVPDDLLLSFGQFVTKYSIGALVPFMWTFVQGIGDLLNVPTIYVMKYLGISSLGNIQDGFLTTAAHDNSLLYESAQVVLGDNVLYNSTVVDVERRIQGISMIVKTPEGLVLVESKKLIVAIQPTLENMKPFVLSETETAIFKQFTNSEYFTAVLRNSGIPDNITLANYSPDLPFNIPAPPSVYSFSQTGVPNLQLAMAISTTPTKDGETAKEVLAALKRIQLPGLADSQAEFEVQYVIDNSSSSRDPSPSLCRDRHMNI